MSYISDRDIESLRPEVEKVLERVLGNNATDIRDTVIKCLQNGYERRQIIDKLSQYVDSKKSSKIYDKLEDTLEQYKSAAKARKRVHEDEDDKQSKKLKTMKSERNFSREDEKDESIAAEPPKVESSLSSQQITQMMANAQREIQERKKALTALKTKDPPNQEDVERAKKIAFLQAQIKAKLSGALSAVIPPVQEKPKPLILDEQGRTVDNSGRAISMPTLAPTLKANIRAKKKESFNKVSQPNDKQQQDEGLKFFDDRITIKPSVRNKRALRFHEPGKFQQMAEKMRMKSQLEKLQNEISQIARKTGISSATKLALIAPKQDSHADDVPQMEWWDSVILANDLSTLDGDKIAIRESAISNLIEHPTQMKPPSEYTFC